MRVAYITAGAAGMYCGSCIHDNALAAALSRCDADVALIPTYTPVRTDEENVSLDRIFYSGVNIFLQQQWSFFRRTHRLFDRVLDSPFLIRTLARFGSSTNASALGPLTVSVLAGEEGKPTKGTHPSRRLAPARLQTRPHPANQRHVRRHGPAIKSTIRRPRPLRPPRRGPVLRRPSRTLEVPSPENPAPTRPRHRRLHRPVCVLPRVHGRVPPGAAHKNPCGAARPQSDRTRPRATTADRQPLQNRLPRPHLPGKGLSPARRCLSAVKRTARVCLPPSRSRRLPQRVRQALLRRADAKDPPTAG